MYCYIFSSSSPLLSSSHLPTFSLLSSLPFFHFSFQFSFPFSCCYVYILSFPHPVNFPFLHFLPFVANNVIFVEKCLWSGCQLTLLKLFFKRRHTFYTLPVYLPNKQWIMVIIPYIFIRPGMVDWFRSFRGQGWWEKPVKHDSWAHVFKQFKLRVVRKKL